MYTSYEDYSNTSKNYDTYRKAIGIDFIKNEINQYSKNNNINLKDLRLLDLGCGTGNYSIVLKDFVGEIVAVEYNKGMLDVFKKKLGDNDNIKLVEGSAFNLPFEKETFDIIIMNQVIHHLDGKKGDLNSNSYHNNFPNCWKTWNEIFRVLKKNGKFLMNFTQNHQLKAYWYIQHLIPQTMKKFRSTNPSTKFLLNNLKFIGFNDIKVERINENLMEDKFLFDTKLVFENVFRNCDSIWSLVDDSEIKDSLKHYEELIDELGEENFLDIIKYENKVICQSSELVATK